MAAASRKAPPPAQRRWSRRKEARPGEILKAALEVFVERGFAAARLEDVAARAGVSKGTLYLYFGSKEELFKAVVRESLVPDIARAEEMVAQFEGPTDELIRRMLNMIALAIATSPVGALPKLVISESGNFPDIARFYLEEVIHRGFRLIETVLRRGIDRGEFRTVDAPLAVRTVVAPLVLLALWKNSFQAHDRTPLDAEDCMEQYADILMNGLLAGPAAGAGG